MVTYCEYICTSAIYLHAIGAIISPELEPEHVHMNACMNT